MSTWYSSPETVLRRSSICTASELPGSSRAAPKTRPSWSRTASQPIEVSVAEVMLVKLPAGWLPTDTASPLKTAEGAPVAPLFAAGADDVSEGAVVVAVGVWVCEPVFVVTHHPPTMTIRTPAPIMNQLVLSDVFILSIARAILLIKRENLF